MVKIKIENPFEDLDIKKYILSSLSDVILPTESIEIFVGNEDYIRSTQKNVEIRVKYSNFLKDQTRNYIVLLFQMARQEIYNDFYNINDNFVRYIIDEYYAAKNVKFDLYSFVYRMALEDVYSLMDYMKVRILIEFLGEDKENVLKILKRKGKYENKAKEILSYLPSNVEMLLKYVKNLRVRN